VLDLSLIALLAVAQERTFPGAGWTGRSPAEAGVQEAGLERIREYLGGRGFIARRGYRIYTWGDAAARGDVASAAKPWYAHFLFKAVEEGRLAGLDVEAVTLEPRLDALNPALGHKDRAITFRHLANQTSCYGVREKPGAAYDYNDWQMALLWDTLFLKVWGAAYETVDATILRPRLTDALQCEDAPTFMAFGTRDRPGRLSVSPRDFARFGLLYLHGGNWNGRRLLSAEHARMAVTHPLPNSIPRTAGEAAAMIPGQRTLGSSALPDNQTDHHGSYSWLWWVNGVDRNGNRLWPDAPLDLVACLGHKNGMRGMAVLPAQEVVISWNDTTLDRRPERPHPLNEVFKLLVQACGK
jgi:CubicO group peptidase (beta-lactamase class C family)